MEAGDGERSVIVIIVMVSQAFAYVHITKLCTLNMCNSLCINYTQSVYKCVSRHLIKGEFRFHSTVC